VREKRDYDTCDSVDELFQTCITKAHDAYKADVEAGDDGAPNWLARKNCNYLTAAVEDCGNDLMGDCYDEETVTEMKDSQFSAVVDQLDQTLEEWDHQLCPAVREYVERLGNTGVSTTEQADDADDVEDSEDDENEDEGTVVEPEEDEDEDVESAGVMTGVSCVLVMGLLLLQSG